MKLRYPHLLFLITLFFIVIAVFYGPFQKKQNIVSQIPPKTFPIFGAWICDSQPYNCTWSDPITSADLATGGSFDKKYHWVIDQPALNLVVLSFVNPEELLEKFNSSLVVDGLPIGMNQEVVNYFKSRGLRVMLALGGVAYNEDWNLALATNPKQLALNAAAVAQKLGVGIEINFEDPDMTLPRMSQLEDFIVTYRSVHPYDATGQNPAARLTIDLPIGNGFLHILDEWASRRWLQNDSDPKMKLDYANSLVADKQFTAPEYQKHWQENLDGSSDLTPPIVPLVGSKFTVSLYLEDSKKLYDECTNFPNSLLSYRQTGQYVITHKILGYMFWAVGNPIGQINTYPPHTCQNGLGKATEFYGIPVPMPPLPQL